MQDRTKMTIPIWDNTFVPNIKESSDDGSFRGEGMIVQT